MKTLYLDCSMGAAGDMLSAALCELLPDPEAFLMELNALSIPGVRFEREFSEKCGIRGTHFSVLVNGEEESEEMHSHPHGHAHEHTHEHEHEHEHDHSHEHEHEHEHEHTHEHGHEHHHHSGLHEIEHIVRDLGLTKKVEADVLSVYRLIAAAESEVHGVPVSEIHFHEVGTMDAVADITAACLAMNRLGVEKVVVSPIHVGSGTVHCAHGILPVPAPATANLLRDIPIYSGEIRGELCTPTGAALLRHFATEFGAMPPMKISKIGYGMGKKDFPQANCVRAFLGESGDEGRDRILELSCNLDDMTGEAIGFACKALLSAGANDVFTVPVSMKKSRPGTLLKVLCKEADREKFVSLIFRHTTTIGIRENVLDRFVLVRREETLETPYGPVRCKISEGYGTKRTKFEYEDLARIAREREISLEEAKALIGSVL